MRDLKHLIYFENLLQEANNDLVKQAKSDGKLALGYTCYFMPEVLLDLPGCFSVRLRAPRCTSPDMATYYMSSRTCHYGRSLLERALEGGFNFLDAQLATETCTVTCRFRSTSSVWISSRMSASSASSWMSRSKRRKTVLTIMRHRSRPTSWIPP